MRSSATDVVVVLAAGLGSRLTSETGAPKPLRPIGGRPLILHVLDRFRDAGIGSAVIIVGHRADEVSAEVRTANPPMPVRFVENARYRLNNGLSVLAAREAVGNRSFFISMADHIFDADIITGLKHAQLPPSGLILAVDRKLDTIFDMDDATKVRTDGDRIIEIGKTLETYDAVDTGLFRCTPALFDAIEAHSASRADGDCSLSEGVAALTARGDALVHDIGAARWQDVDTPETEAHARDVFG